MSVLSREERYYASKPLACSSPIVKKKDGVLVRVHDGYDYGRGQYLVGPSTYPVNDQFFLTKEDETNILGE
jgi:hypothetical protein